MSTIGTKDEPVRFCDICGVYKPISKIIEARFCRSNTPGSNDKKIIKKYFCDLECYKLYKTYGSTKRNTSDNGRDG